MDPHGRSPNSLNPSSADSIPQLSANQAFSPRLLSPSDSVESPGLHSLKSVQSVQSIPVTGVYPFGSLHLNEPKDESQSDIDLATPLTIPDRTPEPIMDKDAELLKGGDVILLDDLPTNFTVGCDTVSFSTTQQFLGFKDIPQGAHLIWVASSESTSLRSAYWIATPPKDENSPGRVHVKQWDKFNEVLSDPASQAEERFQKERLGEIFSKLAPYQFKASTSAVPPSNRPETPEPLPPFLSNTTIWLQLTFAIQEDLLNRLTGEQKETWQVGTSDRIVGETSLPEEARLYPSSAAQLKFSFAMDQHLFDPQAEGSERTSQALDPTSWVLAGPVDSLLGELQFAFLTGTHLGNYSCLEQWWFYVTRIVFRAYRLATERPQLARDLIQTFHAQLAYDDRYLEGDGVLDAMPEHARHLQRALTLYKSRLNEQLLALGDRCSPDQNDVGKAFSLLESWLWRFGWDLRAQYVRSGTVMLEDGEVVDAELSDFESEDERGEFAAVVVDVDEDGRQTDLVSV